MTKEGKLRKNGARAGRVTRTWPLSCGGARDALYFIFENNLLVGAIPLIRKT